VEGSTTGLGAKLTPGEYLLQVVVTDGLAKKKHSQATQWIDSEVTGNSPNLTEKSGL
jgi:hypothetical protein